MPSEQETRAQRRSFAPGLPELDGIATSLTRRVEPIERARAADGFVLGCNDDGDYRCAGRPLTARRDYSAAASSAG